MFQVDFLLLSFKVKKLLINILESNFNWYSASSFSQSWITSCSCWWHYKSLNWSSWKIHLCFPWCKVLGNFSRWANFILVFMFYYNNNGAWNLAKPCSSCLHTMLTNTFHVAKIISFVYSTFCIRWRFLFLFNSFIY